MEGLIIMKKEKLSSVIEGIIILVFGILIAVCGIDSTVNLYFGILFTIIGASALGVALTLFIKKAPVTGALFFLSGIALSLGICLFTNWVSFSVLIPLLVAAVLGLGAGLIAHGCYFAIRHNAFYGIGEMVVGIAVVVLAALYMGVPQFRAAFWLVAGILIAIYGAFNIIFALVRKK